MSIQRIQNGSLEYLAAERISVPHCFTTRLGGVSEGYLASLNLGMNRGDVPDNVVKNYRILAAEFGFDLSHLVLTHQTHSDIVRIVTKEDSNGLDHHAYPECDAVITADPGTALMIFTADCTPILFHDPITGVVGAAHAGWRGTASKIAAKTVAAMAETFGCRPENIRAAIGPNIAQCCFETDADVPEAMLEAIGDAANTWIRKTGHKYHVDLKQINAYILREAGVREIDISSDCTACLPDRYWSHRVTKGHRGSQGAMIVCKEVNL